MLTFNESLDTIAGLVKHFGANHEAYRSTNYKEAQVRSEFIDKFFDALGWDVSNSHQLAPQYREVIPEASLVIDGGRKAPDYEFRIEQTPKYYVEAKRPNTPIEKDIESAYQLRRYAWTANLPLSLLTDFEQLSVYDCRIRPVHGDPADVALVRYYEFDKYPENWHTIWDLFSREAVYAGSLEQFTQDEKNRRGTSPVDAEFLKEIENWRIDLARNFALRNPGLTTEELNDAVQRTIDRIIFLRMAEDRGIEPYGGLHHIATGENVYAELILLCRAADVRYNSGLFDFSPQGDTLTPRLVVDDKVLRSLFSNLYYPRSPYAFSVFPAEILGIAYEQFLGKVIRLTVSHRAKIEEKPEVKKAGGVVYTPTYIVERIVRNTVGKLIDGKSPSQLKAFRVLDASAGSGSFTHCVYSYLLNYYLKWYTQHEPEKHKDEVWRFGNEWRLTVAAKKRILTTHIFGVDIDARAVEVAKLSLLLRVLEGENSETLNAQMLLFPEPALPNLDNNIKCGNSLIGPDYFARQLLPNEEELKRINPFDWNAEFPEVMRAGGFDCLVGNPPYIRIQIMKEFFPLEVEIYKKLYATAHSGNYDIYVVFIEKMLSLLNKNGLLGIIAPHKFFNAKYGQPLRRLLSDGKHLVHIVHFGDQQVFSRVTTYTCLLFLTKASNPACWIEKVNDLNAWRRTGEATEGTILAEGLTAAEWNFSIGKSAALIHRLNKMPVKLSNVAARIYQGPITSADTVYLFKQFRPGKKKGTTEVFSEELNEWVSVESNILRSVIRSGSIRRYTAQPTAWVLFPYAINDNAAHLYTTVEMKNCYPLAWGYLRRNKKLLEGREKGKFRDAEWYRFGRNQNLGMWEQPKLLIPYMITELSAYLDQDDNYYFINVTTGGYGITVDQEKEGSLTYLCGLLNSHLLGFYLKSISTNFRGGYFAANKQYIEQLPIRAIDFSSSVDTASHDNMVLLVQQMSELHKRLASVRTEHDRTLLQRQINATDKEIDRLVYELYGLSDKEISVVEE